MICVSRCRNWLLIFATWAIPTSLFAQTGSSSSMNWVDSVLAHIRTDQSMDARTKCTLADSAFKLSLAEKNICKQVYARIIQSRYLDDMGMPDSALTQLYWASKSYQPSCDSLLMMTLYSNLTSVYLSLSELDRIDSVCKIALAYWNPKWKTKDSRFAILNNQGIAQ